MSLAKKHFLLRIKAKKTPIRIKVHFTAAIHNVLIIIIYLIGVQQL